MDDEKFNMSMRKFLKQVGVTSQREIETAVRASAEAGKLGNGPLKAKVRLTLDGVDLDVTIDGEIEVG